MPLTYGDTSSRRTTHRESCVPIQVRTGCTCPARRIVQIPIEALTGEATNKFPLDPSPPNDLARELFSSFVFRKIECWKCLFSVKRAVHTKGKTCHPV